MLTTMPEVRRPSFPRMVGRALLLRCPWCAGRRAWFDGWFKLSPRCHTCGYKYERQVGFMLGSLTMNVIVTFGAVAIGLIVGLVFFSTTVAIVLTVVAGIVLPIVGYPFTVTLWAAIDLLMRPLEPDEIAHAQAHASDPARTAAAGPVRR